MRICLHHLLFARPVLSGPLYGTAFLQTENLQWILLGPGLRSHSLGLHFSHLMLPGGCVNNMVHIYQVQSDNLVTSSSGTEKSLIQNLPGAFLKNLFIQREAWERDGERRPHGLMPQMPSTGGAGAGKNHESRTQFNPLM